MAKRGSNELFYAIIVGLNKELSEKAIKDHVQKALVELMSHKNAKKKSMGANLLKKFTENMVPYEIARYSLNYSIDGKCFICHQWNRCVGCSETHRITS